jgi:NAD(P)-dependent dehydrogenase (short-subunit alcohol dehydrogenase family)
LHIAKRTVHNPAKLFLADISSSGLRETLSMLPPEAVAYGTVFNSADSAACREFIMDAVKKEGRIDGALLCAGMPAMALPLRETSDEYFQQMMTANVFSLFATIRAIVALPISQTPGTSIVAVSSGVGIEGAADLSVYSSTKAAVIGFCKSLAKELGPRGIRVNALAPAFIQAGRDRGSMAMNGEDVGRNERTPLGRMGQPEEVASAAAFLLSGDSSFVSGSVMEIDGGK